MSGEFGKDKRCPLCGGDLKRGVAAIPYLLPDAVIVVKDVPAEICNSCGEAFTSGSVTDHIVAMLGTACALKAEVLVLSYQDIQPLTSFVSA
jgi:YgiT-type zinc finger domain-containing protein